MEDKQNRKKPKKMKQIIIYSYRKQKIRKKESFSVQGFTNTTKVNLGLCNYKILLVNVVKEDIPFL